MATIGFSKVFILDKYFAELQKFWETEKKLQGMQSDSSNEKAHLQQRLQSLSSELVSLRNHLQVNNGPPQLPPPLVNGYNNTRLLNHPNGHSTQPSNIAHPNSAPQQLNHNNNGHNSSLGYKAGGYRKPLPPRPVTSSSTATTTHAMVHHHLLNNQQQQSTHFYVNQQFPKDLLSSEVICGDEKAGGSVAGTRTSSSGDRDDVTPSVSSHSSSFKLSGKSVPNSICPVVQQSPPKKVQLSAIEDLIHLPGALTEDSLIRSLQARAAAGKHFVYMGPILLLANPLTSLGNSLTLNSTRTLIPPPPIQRIVEEALRQQAETGYPQAIILSGSSGSGKTYTSMLLLRQLFQSAGCGTETDAFRHLTASVTVIRSLGTAATAANPESSRIGHFIEVQVTDGSLYRAKVHCYFLDQTRVVRSCPDERNYHIFYQMLAGLTSEERSRLHLGSHSARTLRYLNASEQKTDDAEDARRFLDWKTCLCVLGIPFLDVVRVLAAVVLLGNVKFNQSSLGLDVEEGECELESSASLLGVSQIALRQGLTLRTHNARGQLVRSRSDAETSNKTRDALAKSLYCRTVATIVRRANSLKRLNSNSGTLSSDSADSVHNQAEVASTIQSSASTVGTAGSKASKSMTALMAAVRHATDGFIGILDMFGFEDLKQSRLEHLCINLCAETMQHFYNTHIFKASIESCREEGILVEEIEYHDNVPCIDLISSLRTGLLSMLDVECSVRGTVESYIQKVQIQHTQNPRFLETRAGTELARSFAIHHFAGKVHYDATEFQETNRDVLADDLVAVFHKHRCSFGFASHLFSSELKVLGAGGVDPCPKGISFRILPTSNAEMLNGEEPVSTFTQDFHTRLDNLLRTLVHTKPHFIRCLSLNQSGQRDLFDRHTVAKQLRAFQVLETVNLMYGYPHRMRLKAFNSRYKLIAPFRDLSRTEDRAVDDSARILKAFHNSVQGEKGVRDGHGQGGQISMGSAIGKRHVFLSEGARQELESLRVTTRNRAATLIQTTYRGWFCRRRWPVVRQAIQQRRHQLAAAKSREVVKVTSADLPVGSQLSPSYTNSPFSHHHMMDLNTTENGAGLMHQVFPVPAQRTSSAAVITSTTTVHPNNQNSSNALPNSQNLYNANPNNQNNYKNILPPSPGQESQPLSSLPPNGSERGGDLSGRPRPQPITGTPPPESQPPEIKLVHQICSLYGLDMERPPSLPPSRPYTVNGNLKYNFPQTRVIKKNFPDDGRMCLGDVGLSRGDFVSVVGPSPRRGHLIVEYKSRTLHLPHHFLQLRASQ